MQAEPVLSPGRNYYTSSEAVSKKRKRDVLEDEQTSERQPERARTRLLIIADPIRYLTRPAAEIESSWVNREISEKDYKVVKDVEGKMVWTKTILPSERREVRIEEWMLVAILLNSRQDAEVEVCDGQWYMNALMRNMPPEDLDVWWNYLISFDCIVGGFDFSINYWMWYPDCDEEKLTLIRRGLNDLSEETRLWPHFEQVESFSNKILLAKRLDAIARDSGMPRPMTTVIQRGDPIPSDVVVKRTYSECGNDVYLPGEFPGWVALQGLYAPPQATYFTQTYIPTLRTHGEFRTVFCGPDPIYTIHTRKNKKGQFEVRPVTRWHSLEVLTKTYASNPAAQFVVDNELGGSDEGKVQYFQYVTQVWRALWARESNRTGTQSSITVFCRIDVGVIFLDGKAYYFVNEVERTLAASLWSGVLGVPLDGFAQAFGDQLCGWISKLDDPVARCGEDPQISNLKAQVLHLQKLLPEPGHADRHGGVEEQLLQQPNAVQDVVPQLPQPPEPLTVMLNDFELVQHCGNIHKLRVLHIVDPRPYISSPKTDLIARSVEKAKAIECELPDVADFSFDMRRRSNIIEMDKNSALAFDLHQTEACHVYFGDGRHFLEIFSTESIKRWNEWRDFFTQYDCVIGATELSTGSWPAELENIQSQKPLVCQRVKGIDNVWPDMIAGMSSTSELALSLRIWYATREKAGSPNHMTAGAADLCITEFMPGIDKL